MRKIIGKDKIIGVSVHDIQELDRAIDDGADYVGIGACFGTKTKDLKQAPIGPIGVKEILEHANHRIPAVVIGGVNAKNVQQVLYFSTTPEKETKLDGVAVVSAIMASEDPAEAARELKALIHEPVPWSLTSKMPWGQKFAKGDLIQNIGDLVSSISSVRPLVHHLTNDVTKNFSANVSISIGASPIMTESTGEFEELSNIKHAGLLVNMGNPSPDGVDVYLTAGSCYNHSGNVTVYDPVGAGATSLRAGAAKEILKHTAFNVIKGNDGEIFAVSGVQSNTKAHGVDSFGDSGLDQRYQAASTLARRCRTVVLMTGKEDLLVDELGNALVFSNGSKYLASITGSGCVLGSIVTAFCSTDHSLIDAEEKVPYGSFVATAAAISLYTIASERAERNPACGGPGTFIPLLLDELYKVQAESTFGNFHWLNALDVRPYEP